MIKQETAAAEQASRLHEVCAKTVLVPPGDEVKPIACPVCKETLKAEFNGDDEDDEEEIDDAADTGAETDRTGPERDSGVRRRDVKARA